MDASKLRLYSFSILTQFLVPVIGLVVFYNSEQLGFAAPKTLSFIYVLSVALIIAALIYLAIICVLSFTPLKSHQGLINSMRYSWWLTMGYTICSLLAQALIFGSLMLIFTNEYGGNGFAKLGFLVLLGVLGLVAFVTVILVSRPDLSVTQDVALVLEPQDAPDLWSDVNGLAQSLETEPPDNIIVGMGTSFFVTENPILVGEKACTGRSLFLSVPALARLNTFHARAIIAHELSHFKGMDTHLSRELYPQFNRFGKIYESVEDGGWVSLPAKYILAFFAQHLFSKEAEHRRVRELRADASAASVTSPEDMAAALVRIHLVDEVISHTEQSWDLDRPFMEQVVENENKLSQVDEFWHVIGRQTMAHPFDSHPSLHDRLQNLSVRPSNLSELNQFNPYHSAKDWFFGADNPKINQMFDEFFHAAKEFDELHTIYSMQGETEHESALIEGMFPTKTWQATKTSLILVVVIVTFFAAMGSAPFFLMDLTYSPFYFVVPIWILAAGLIFYIQRHGENSQFTLDHEGFKSSDWTRKVLFSEIDGMETQENYGIYTVRIKFTKKAEPYSKINLLPGKKSHCLLKIGSYIGHQEEIIEHLFGYYNRYLYATQSQEQIQASEAIE